MYRIYEYTNWVSSCTLWELTILVDGKLEKNRTSTKLGFLKN